MDYVDYLIVGSGAAGVAAAWSLRDKNVAIFDVGRLPNGVLECASKSSLLATGSAQAVLGEHWEMLDTLHHTQLKPPKLRAQLLQHIANGESATVAYQPNQQVIINGSYAQGGLANAWGAQLLRYTQKDLDECGDWPITADDLAKYYELLEQHIGISGEADDMVGFLGPTQGLLKPIPILPLTQHLLSRCGNRAKTHSNQNGDTVKFGYPRLAVLTERHGDRAAHEFGETDFFEEHQHGVYSPKITLHQLIKQHNLVYRPQQQLIDFTEYADHVVAVFRDVNDHRISTIKTKSLLIACGVLHTTKLMLNKFGTSGESLSFIDHPPSLLPIFFPRFFGKKLPSYSYPIQAIATYGDEAGKKMVSFYYAGGVLKGDLLADLPIPLSYSRQLLPYLLSGMLVAQIWTRSKPSSANQIYLDRAGNLAINYGLREPVSAINQLIAALRKAGGYSIAGLLKESPPGWGFHYAATLPMRTNPKKFETHTDGRLWNSARIRVIDGSVLPSLPAKNHSLTMMANAIRIAEGIK